MKEIKSMSDSKKETDASLTKGEVLAVFSASTLALLTGCKVVSPPEGQNTIIPPTPTTETYPAPSPEFVTAIEKSAQVAIDSNFEGLGIHNPNLVGGTLRGGLGNEYALFQTLLPNRETKEDLSFLLIGEVGEEKGIGWIKGLVLDEEAPQGEVIQFMSVSYDSENNIFNLEGPFARTNTTTGEIELYNNGVWVPLLASPPTYDAISREVGKGVLVSRSLPTPTAEPEPTQEVASYPAFTEEMGIILGNEFEASQNAETGQWEVRIPIGDIQSPSVYLFNTESSQWEETEWVYFAKVTRMGEILATINLSEEIAALPTLAELGLRPLSFAVRRSESNLSVESAYLIGYTERTVDLGNGESLETKLLAFSAREGQVFWVPAYVEAFDDAWFLRFYRQGREVNLYTDPDAAVIGRRYYTIGMRVPPTNWEEQLSSLSVASFEEAVNYFVEDGGWTREQIIKDTGEVIFATSLLEGLNLSEEQLLQNFPFPSDRPTPSYSFQTN